MAAALRGKQIAFTGTFENMNRAQVVKATKSIGGLVHGRGATVSKNIDVLVTGDSNVGVKKVQAKHLGIPIVPASSFHKFVQSGGASRVARASAFSAAPARRTYTPRAEKKAAMMEEDFEEEFEAAAEEEEEQKTLMPWETDMAREPKKKAVSTVRNVGRPVGRPRRMAIERPVRATRAAMAPRVAPVREAPKARRAAAVQAPFWSLRGMNVGFAGSFDAVTKPEAAIMAERNGANVLTTPHVDILICGKGAEAKRMLAKKRGIMAVSESTFLRACRK